MSVKQNKFGRILCLDDFEARARRHLPESIFGYVSGATETNASFMKNRAAFQQWSFLPRFLNNVSAISTDTELWGDTYAWPFGIAPMGLGALWALQGDKQLARSAQKNNIPMIMSGSSLIRLEEVSKLGTNIWFQAYLPGSNEEITQLVERVRKAGFQRLVITVDTPVAANRENNVRAGFSPMRPRSAARPASTTPFRFSHRKSPATWPCWA